ncbi:MAG TPA: aldo/keto reductase [Alphaproteobacteria bacterium]|nr:aldo/keto reductase [Alphaproteobacteria bacterium]
MEKRKLGASGLEVYPLCFGGNVFGWTIDQTQSFPLLDAFVDAGFNFIDTADVYSVWKPGNQGGESETIIGEWFKQSGKRDKVVIATKVGMALSPEKKGLAGKYIMQAVEDSLTRLQTDYIDLYQSHTDDETVPLEETLGAYQKLIAQGKVRAIGASNYSGARLAEAVKIAKENNLPVYQSLQPEYNIYDRRKFEEELAPVCLKEGIGVISYYSLARGFLSGKYRTENDLGKSTRGDSVKKNYFNERGFRILNALDGVAAQASATQAQVALAWLMTRPGITAPIASATSLDQLDDMIKSAHLKLSEDALDKLEHASAFMADAA